MRYAKGSRLAGWQLSLILLRLRQGAPVRDIAEEAEVNLFTVYTIKKEREQHGETFPPARLRPAPELTSLQTDLLLKILAYRQRHGRYPHIRLIARMRGASLEATYGILCRLREKGFVNWDQNTNGKRSPVRVTAKGRATVSLLSDTNLSEVLCQPSQTKS